MNTTPRRFHCDQSMGLRISESVVIGSVHLRGYECTIHRLFPRGDCEQATSLRGAIDHHGCQPIFFGTRFAGYLDEGFSRALRSSMLTRIRVGWAAAVIVKSSLA